MTSSLPPGLFTLTPFWLQAQGWDRFPGLVHGFSGRLPKNATLFSQAQGGNFTLCMVKQVHGEEIIVANQHCKTWEKQPEADGIVTTELGLLLGIVSADCVPLLIVAPQQGIVAALHAGWRGTLKGISIRAMDMFTSGWHIDPTSLWIALGPAIGGCCYEVGVEVGESLVQRWNPSSPTAWQPYGERGLLDLREINLVQFEQAGVPRERIQLVGPCTFCDSSRFASYRREGLSASRQLSVIGWQTQP